MSRSEYEASQMRALQAAHEKAEAARWEAMATQARRGMAVHEPLSHDDRQTLRRIYAALAVFWGATIACGVYFMPQIFKLFF